MTDSLNKILDENSYIEKQLTEIYELIYKDEIFKKIKTMYGFTPAQTGVVKYLIFGHTNKEIAKLIFKTQGNVEKLLMTIYCTLRVKSSRQAIVKLLLTAFAIIRENK